MCRYNTPQCRGQMFPVGRSCLWWYRSAVGTDGQIEANMKVCIWLSEAGARCGSQEKEESQCGRLPLCRRPPAAPKPWLSDQPNIAHLMQAVIRGCCCSTARDQVYAVIKQLHTGTISLMWVHGPEEKSTGCAWNNDHGQ